MATKKKSKFNIVSVLNGLLIVLVLFSLMADGLFIYYKFFNRDVTIGVYNITSQVAKDLAIKKFEDMTEDEIAEHEARTFIVANLYSNDRKNGIELQEMNINYFSGFNLTRKEYRASGMQYIGDSSTIRTTNMSDGYVLGVKNMDAKYTEEDIYRNFIFYDTTNGITWGQTGNDKISSRLNKNSHLIIQIDGEAYDIQLNKSKRYGFMLTFWEVSSMTTYANYGSLFQSVMEAIKTSNVGYGDYYITIDLSDFFTIRKYDSESKKFIADDVSDVIKEYAEMRFHYDANGAVDATQSIFGSIDCSSTYGLTEQERNTEYWRENIIFNYDLNNLKLRYSEIDNGYYVGLDTVSKNKITNSTRIKLNITIDLTSTNKNILGLDFEAFKGVKISSLKIIGSGEFVLKEGSLLDTNITKIEKSHLLTIINDNSTNNILEVVTI